MGSVRDQGFQVSEARSQLTPGPVACGPAAEILHVGGLSRHCSVEDQERPVQVPSPLQEKSPVQQEHRV
jgi:hypothetical protein